MAAAQEGKAIVLRWLGARQRFYGKADSEGFRFNAKYTFCLIWLLFIASIAIILIYTRSYSKKVQTLLLK